MSSSLRTTRLTPIVTLAMPSGLPFMEISDSWTLAWSIVDTLREPVLVLERDLRVVAASRAFERAFAIERRDILCRPIFALCDNQWDIPELRSMLLRVLDEGGSTEILEIDREFSGLGRRSLRLHARAVPQTGIVRPLILLAIEDLTAQQTADAAAALALERMETLLLEAQHRIANSLQVIASILLLKARRMQSAETRMELEDAHRRILSVATVQLQLHVAQNGTPIALAPYLKQLGKGLAASLAGVGRSITIEVRAEPGVATATEAVSIGLIVTELVINALKHAFVGDRTDGVIVVAYDQVGPNWRLAVSDNGVGKPAGRVPKIKPGLGTSIIEALARQLSAQVKISRLPHGTTVSITHGKPLRPVTPRRTAR